MSKKEKFIKFFLAIVFLVGVSYAPLMLDGQKGAQVISFFSSNNTNETVLKAQTKLKEIDLYKGRLSGLFGFRTRSAIIDFQNLVGLTPNGILDIPTQTMLFSYVPPTRQDPIEFYLVLPSTEEGNAFINIWANQEYEASGIPVELLGYLKDSSESAVYDKKNPRPTSIVFSNEDGFFYVESVLPFDFTEYFGQKVMIKGVLMSSPNNRGEKHILVNPNLVTEISLEDSNFDLNTWTMNTYNEIGTPVYKTGVLRDIGVSASYRSGGNPSSYVLYTDSGKFLIENALENDYFRSLINQEISIEGVLMSGTNILGIQTIIVGYGE